MKTLMENEKVVLSEAEQQIIETFANTAVVLGLPKSYGQIYGYLFAQVGGRTMEQVISALDISLGSASQGLRALRNLGAVKTEFLPGTKRDTYLAELEFKKLMGGFLRTQLLPHLDSGKLQIEKLERSIPDVEDKQHRQALQSRLKKLKDWKKKAGRILPLLEILLTK